MADQGNERSGKRKIEKVDVGEEKEKKPKIRYEQINRTISDIIDMDPSERSGIVLKVRLMGKRLQTNGINTNQEENTLILYFKDRVGDVCGVETWRKHAVNLYHDLLIGKNYRITFGGDGKENAKGRVVPFALHHADKKTEMHADF